MTLNQLASKLAALSPEQRQVVELLVELLARPPRKSQQRDLTDHPSFGAWAKRADLPKDSDLATRELRERAVRRGNA
jgi:hypothetical protein